VPRYFFDTHDGEHLIPDDTGQELDGLEDAKATAQKALLNMAKDKLSGGDQRVFMVTVRDNADEVMRAALAMRVEYSAKAQE
jgi:hypothetical protein